MTTESIQEWHARARPRPTDKDLNVQLGCHLEEVAEMLSGVEMPEYPELMLQINAVAIALKNGYASAKIFNRKELLDSLADQIVTAVGVGHCAGMDVNLALARINFSNWSKFDSEGRPIFDANGKITKGPNYRPPDLEGLT